MPQPPWAQDEQQEAGSNTLLKMAKIFYNENGLQKDGEFVRNG